MKKSKSRRAISEMLGAVILIMITLLAFGFITLAFYSQTSVSTTNLVQEYEAGQIKAGQLLSLVYHTESSTTIVVAVDNFGFYPISPEQVYITQSGMASGNPQLLWTGAPQIQCFDSTGSLAVCPNGQIAPKQIGLITVNIPSNLQNCSSGGWCPGGTYDFFLYTSTNEGYDWTL